MHAIEAEDTAIAILEFASGGLGILQATTAASPGYPRRLEISGTEGTSNLRNAPALISAGAAPDQNESASSPVLSDLRGHQACSRTFSRR